MFPREIYRGDSDYDQAIRLKPDYDQAYCYRGLAKYRLKNYSEAIADCDQALQLKPDYTQAYCLRGLAKYRLKNYSEAIADHDQAIH